MDLRISTWYSFRRSSHTSVPRLSRGHVLVTEASNRVLTCYCHPGEIGSLQTQYMAVKTFCVDTSSRFTTSHCLSYYQAINSTARMNWLTSRVAGVASCNLITYIILSVSSPSPRGTTSFPHLHVVR